MATLQVEYMNIDAVLPYVGNAKEHPRFQIEQIKESIARFGMDDPIAIWGDKNVIVEGHGRLIACKELGYETVPVIRLNHLTDEERKAYTLVHNKLTLNSGFDLNMLADEIRTITDIDMSRYGFDLADLAGDPIKGTDDAYEGDVPQEAKAKLGDIYILGNHRLMCGDSTSPTDVAKLMDGKKCSLLFYVPSLYR